MTEPIDAFCFVAAIEDLDVFHHLFAGFVSLVVVGDLGHDLCQSLIEGAGAGDALLNSVWIMVLVLGWLFSKKFWNRGLLL